MRPIVDQEIAREHLELANRHVGQGEHRVEAQRALIAKLERDGHNTAQALSLLEQFQLTLSLQIQTRDRIAQQLAEIEDPWSRKRA